MFAMTAISFDRGALMQMINDLKAIIRALQMRTDTRSLKLRPLLEKRLTAPKSQLIDGHKPRLLCSPRAYPIRNSPTLKPLQGCVKHAERT